MKTNPETPGQELKQEVDGLIDPGYCYPIGSLDRAAAALLKVLEDEKEQP